MSLIPCTCVSMCLQPNWTTFFPCEKTNKHNDFGLGWSRRRKRDREYLTSVVLKLNRHGWLDRSCGIHTSFPLTETGLLCRVEWAKKEGRRIWLLLVLHSRNRRSPGTNEQTGETVKKSSVKLKCIHTYLCWYVSHYYCVCEWFGSSKSLHN